MPVYAYRCESCGVQFERHQSFADSPLKTCPECRQKTLRKVIAPVGIVFKGSGFYATDHKSPSGKVSREKKDEGKPAEEKPAEAKPAESKPSEKKSD